MTEAMSRHEIEDVLSSIRRLVSHEDRSAHSNTPTADAAAPKPVSAPAKLVLTSALRVDDGPVSEATAEAASHDDQTAAANPVAAVPSASPAFADAPVRAPLLTRIAQAGRQSSTPPRAEDMSTESPLSADEAKPLEESVTDNVLEATLARLEQALSIAPPEEPDQSGDMLIDEQALAQIVSKIVRQELQGELGERITRNIRKLVRAEVARELQMRNL